MILQYLVPTTVGHSSTGDGGSGARGFLVEVLLAFAFAVDEDDTLRFLSSLAVSSIRREQSSVELFDIAFFGGLSGRGNGSSFSGI